MPRFLYWTIIVGDQATAFRAREAADLQPTLVQLRRAHPDAVMKWFERGRLWASPEEARAARDTERRESRRRPSTWRPGGEHKDPRQKYKDAKKAKWTRFKDRIRARHEERRPAGAPPVAPPEPPPSPEREGPPAPKPPRSPKPFGAKRQDTRPTGTPRSAPSPRGPRKTRKS